MEITGYHYYQTTLAVICFSGILSAAGGASVGPPDGRRLRCDGYRTYLDHGTGLCELCSEICRNAEIKGTEQQCKENCPGFLQAMRCEEKEGWFYDQRYGDCRSCCDCEHTPALKTVCIEKCAGVPVPPPSSDHVPAHLHTAAAVADDVPISPSPCALNNQHSPPRPSPSDTDVPVWVIVVVIVVAVVLGLITILAAHRVVVMSPTVKPYRPVKQRDSGGPDGGAWTERARGEGGRPVEESRPMQPQSAAVVAADGTIRSMTIPVKTAFADLSVGHDGSRCELV